VTDPDTIRRDIEATRASLGTDVDALAEKVDPSSIAHRQTEKVKGRVRGVRDTLMGAADSVSDALPSPHAGAAAGSAKRAAEGNALVVGLVAFGVGMLVSSFLPAAAKERELASTAEEKAAPLVDAAKGAAQDAAQQLKEPAQDAAQHLKETAQDAAGTVEQEGQAAASDVKDQASSAKDDVSGAARG
jgi:gas vesicle protein